ncbi:MAG: hypothetical protein C0464_03615 [Cyanobacteria bacterium DS2.008]|uniref:hypothetical protein n=1 Tax=Blastomonas sp. TaxID=1909299 RepID=UPI0017A697DD|nr:hypothetical protein [Cyanobacteria bacterium DS2.008]MBA4781363.1 oligosaccharide repeat unit polymerase [Blastomonas sp.]
MGVGKNKIYALIVAPVCLTIMLFAGYDLEFLPLIILNSLTLGVFTYSSWLTISKYRAGISILFLAICAYIYCTAPMLFYYFAPQYAAFYNNTLYVSAIYCSGFFCWLIFWLSIFMSSQDVVYLDGGVRGYIEKFNLGTFHFIFITGFGFVITTLFVSNYYSSGVGALSEGASRLDVTKAVETGRVWLLQYLMGSYFIALSLIWINRAGIPRFMSLPLFLINFIISSIYAFYYISLGNRREVVGPIIFILIIRYMYRGKIDYWVPLLGAIFFGWLGVSRTVLRPNLGLAVDEVLFSAFGEFLLASFSLNFYIEAGFQDYRFGDTIVQSFLAATPLISGDLKPLSLANEFVEILFRGGIGYGFSPMAESYLNFGLFGIIVGPLMIMVPIKILAALRSKISAIILLITASLGMDIFRGESGGIAWQIAIISLFVVLLTGIRRSIQSNP